MSDILELLARFRPGAPALSVGDVLTLSVTTFVVMRVLAGPDRRHGQSVLLWPDIQAG